MVTINIEDRHLIDRYLQDDISGIELQNFQQRLKEDDALVKQVEIQKLIYAGVQKANHENLKEVIISSLDYRKPTVPNALKMIVTFLIITVIGISLWFYVGNETANKDQSNSWFAFLKSKNKDEHVKGSEEKFSQVQKPKVQVLVDTSASSNQKEIEVGDSIYSEKLNATAVADTVPDNNDDNIVVKQDQLLISTTISIEDKGDAGKEVDESLSKETVEQLNPAADLPENEKLPTSFITEFWISPINYRGYKMSKNKLVLFGIEEPDAVKLYRVNDGIYMTYLREYYKLTDTFDFVSYQKLKETEIPLAIR
jgi:hypothetical protein